MSRHFGRFRLLAMIWLFSVVAPHAHAQDSTAYDLVNTTTSDVMAVVVIILIVLVQLVQSIGERIAAAVDKRATKSGGQ